LIILKHPLKFCKLVKSNCNNFKTFGWSSTETLFSFLLIIVITFAKSLVVYIFLIYSNSSSWFQEQFLLFIKLPISKYWNIELMSISFFWVNYNFNCYYRGRFIIFSFYFFYIIFIICSSLLNNCSILFIIILIFINFISNIICISVVKYMFFFFIFYLTVIFCQ